MKKKLSAVLATAMLATSIATPAFAAETAQPTSSAIYVDGVKIAFEAYNINGNNYFKLRDVAFALSGTDTQFNVTWNDAEGVINLISGEDYGKNGSLSVGDGKVKSAVLNDAPIMKDGSYIDMMAYNINGNNYFKLRDLGEQFGFQVGWNGDANAVTIDTDGVVEEKYEEKLPEGANGTSYKEGAQHSQPKAGDTVIKADGTKVVLQNGYGGVLGAGQGVDIYSGVVINGVTVKEGMGSYIDRSTFVKDPRTGEMHSNKDWQKIEMASFPSGLKGDYNGEVYNTFWQWDASRVNPATGKATGYWKWIGPDYASK